MKYLDVLCLLKSLLGGIVLENASPWRSLNYAKKSKDCTVISNTPLKQLYIYWLKIQYYFMNLYRLDRRVIILIGPIYTHHLSLYLLIFCTNWKCKKSYNSLVKLLNSLSHVASTHFRKLFKQLRSFVVALKFLGGRWPFSQLPLQKV